MERLGGLSVLYGAYTQIQSAEEPDLYCIRMYIQTSTCPNFFLHVFQYLRILLSLGQSN